MYNGNISSMMFSMPLHTVPQLYNYKYDQLNRLVSMDVSRGFSSDDNHWEEMTATDLYMEKYSYDGNGNIKTVLRNGNLSA
ncbi:MAG TPA: hypothetical protein PLR74_17620, partial [Agriterribacter sp.]|nr:hypothetical protein [Agriterribacter sp.]